MTGLAGGPSRNTPCVTRVHPGLLSWAGSVTRGVIQSR
jgi:hypothetical protein